MLSGELRPVRNILNVAVKDASSPLDCDAAVEEAATYQITTFIDRTITGQWRSLRNGKPSMKGGKNS
jgi:hypothetical protein